MARIGMKAERQNQILSALAIKGEMSLQELMTTFNCSEATARRDLEELEQSGSVIRRVGGGAMYVKPASVYEVPFIEKQQVLYTEKMAIASLAASLVQEGDVIGLTGGTTTFLISQQLKHRKNITVVTNAVNIAMELSENSDLQVVLTGGVLRNKSFELCGPLAEQTVNAVNINLMFMGIDGFTAGGVSTYSELEANIARMLMRRADKTIAVFDHTKIGRASLFTVAHLNDLHGCITDGEPPEALVNAMKEADTTLYVAQNDNP